MRKGTGLRLARPCNSPDVPGRMSPGQKERPVMNNTMRNLTLTAAALAALTVIAPRAAAQDRGRGGRGEAPRQESRSFGRGEAPRQQPRSFERREAPRQESRGFERREQGHGNYGNRSYGNFGNRNYGNYGNYGGNRGYGNYGGYRNYGSYG